MTVDFEAWVCASFGGETYSEYVERVAAGSEDGHTHLGPVLYRCYWRFQTDEMPLGENWCHPPDSHHILTDTFSVT